MKNMKDRCEAVFFFMLEKHMFFYAELFPRRNSLLFCDEKISF